MRFSSAGLHIIAVALTFAGSTAVDAAAPVTDIKQISLSDAHGCVVTRSGAVRCFGNNGKGQIGNGTPSSYVTPAVQIIAGGVTAIATGSNPASGGHTCAVTNNGALLCWGNNASGQIGNGTVGAVVTKPTQVIASGVTAVAAGSGNTCAIVSGALMCWGGNRFGEIGNNTKGNSVPRPVQVIAAGVTAVAVGGQHTCAVVNGALQCWGYMMTDRHLNPPDRSGGAPGPDYAARPNTIIPSGVTDVAAALHTCAAVRGALQCWGRNFYGQVGAPDPVYKPTEIIASGVTAVTVSEQHTCAIVRGALYCWGSNSRYQLGSNIENSRTRKPLQLIAAGVTAVSVNQFQICAVVNGVLQCTRPQTPSAKQAPALASFTAENTPFSIPEPPLPELPRYGVWRGTVGKAEVMVMLEPETCDSSYYYLRHHWGIGLIEKDKRGLLWAEPKASWKLESISSDAITGQWVSDDGKRTAPISLKRVGTPHVKENECGKQAHLFDAPRVDAQKLSVKEVRVGAQRYRVVSALDGDIQAIELPEDSYKVPNFNKSTRALMHSQIAEYYGCQTAMERGSTDKLGQRPDFSQTMELEFWGGQLLVVKQLYSAYCGGAHPSGGVAGFLVWNLKTDKEVDPWTWVTVRKGKGGYGHELPEKLNAIIISLAAGNKNNDQCADAINENKDYMLRPAKDGLVFSTSFAHVIRACNEDITVPYSRLQPYLTPEGVTAVKALMQ